MFKSKKIIFGVIGAALLASFMVLGVTGFGLYRYVSAAVTPTPVPGAATPDVMSSYWTTFLKSFAQNLGVDQGKLDAAFTAAVNSTIDQAIKDGKLTQTQGDSVKSRYTGGLSAMAGGSSLFGFGRGGMGGFGGRGKGMNGLIANSDIATALNMSEADLTTAIQSGKSIADIAKTQNKDLAQVKKALLDAAKKKLDAEVMAKTITQAQADQAYQILTNSIDAMLNNTRTGKAPQGFGGMGMMGPGFGQVITTANIASALGISEADVNTGLQSGKTIADLAKAQTKDLAVVKTTLLADAKTTLDTHVTNKVLTQAQADQIYQNLTNSIDSMLNNNHPFNGGRGGGGGWFGRPGNGNQNPNPGGAAGSGA